MTWPPKVSTFMQVTGKKLLMECGNQVNLVVVKNDVLVILIWQPNMMQDGMTGLAMTNISPSVKY